MLRQHFGLTARHSESMGSSADLCCLQHRGARLLRHLLLPVSHYISGQTAQARRVVSGFSRSIRRCTAPAGSHTRPWIPWTRLRGSTRLVCLRPVWWARFLVSTAPPARLEDHGANLDVFTSQVDARIDPLPLILHRHHGPMGVPAAPCLDAAVTFYGCLLWVARVDAVLFRWRKSRPPILL